MLLMRVYHEKVRSGSPARRIEFLDPVSGSAKDFDNLRDGQGMGRCCEGDRPPFPRNPLFRVEVSFLEHRPQDRIFRATATIAASYPFSTSVAGGTIGAGCFYFHRSLSRFDHSSSERGRSSFRTRAGSQMISRLGDRRDQSGPPILTGQPVSRVWPSCDNSRFRPGRSSR